MENNYLPIGTVVLLKGAEKRIMITGFCQINADGREYDYCGCLYPEGYMNHNETLLFDKEQIDKIFYVGFIDEEEEEFKKRLDEFNESRNKDN